MATWCSVPLRTTLKPLYSQVIFLRVALAQGLHSKAAVVRGLPHIALLLLLTFGGSIVTDFVCNNGGFSGDLGFTYGDDGPVALSAPAPAPDLTQPAVLPSTELFFSLVVHATLPRTPDERPPIDFVHTVRPSTRAP